MLEDKGIGFRRIRDPFMELCVNQVDEEGVEEDGGQVVRVIGVKVRVVGKGVKSSKKMAWDMDDL